MGLLCVESLIRCGLSLVTSVVEGEAFFLKKEETISCNFIGDNLKKTLGDEKLRKQIKMIVART